VIRNTELAALGERVAAIEAQMEKFKTMFLDDYKVFKERSREFNVETINRLIEERIDSPGLRLTQLIKDVADKYR
jgi:hypothetical protein